MTGLSILMYTRKLVTVVSVRVIQTQNANSPILSLSPANQAAAF